MSIAWRIYADYLMPSRLIEYESLLDLILGSGYAFCTIRMYHRLLNAGRLPEKVVVLRHDIDTDPATAKAFFAIESSRSVPASYYFRLRTLDIPLMREIEEKGSEAGYHFEELATYAKRHHIRESDRLLGCMPEIGAMFAENFLSLENRLGFKISTVASHGDFANRVLGLPNHFLLTDEALRRRLGIECECYDERLAASFDARISDRPLPQRFHPEAALNAIRRGARCICLLTHPRHWCVSISCNTRENLVRLYEQLAW